MLHKDEHVASMEAYTILEKVFMERLLLVEDIEAFSRTLRGHHKSERPQKWGLSLVDLAIVQHNLLGCSNLYSNITISSLAELFNVDESTALNIVAAMILEGRLQGSIDQIDGVVSFEVDDAAAEERDGDRGEGGNQVEEALALADAALAKVYSRYGDPGLP
jgi:COP9 signalosome complex subunit 4